jgi:hypothetical protein
MTDPKELLRRHGTAPGPRAAALVSEVRTQSTMPFHTVLSAAWAGGKSFSVAHEWSCIMTWDQVTKLQAFLQADFPPTAKTPEALINEVMIALNIGHYLGTFIGQGHGGTEVRMLFAYTAGMAVEDIAKVWAALVKTPTAAQKPASDALTALRTFWNAGTENAESGLMLLSGVALDAKLNDDEKFPFGSIDR